MTVQEIKDQIKELFQKLPPVDQQVYETTLLAMQIQTDLMTLLSDEDNDEEKTSEDIEEELKRARNRKAALDDLISINKTIKSMVDEISGEQAETMATGGAGIKKYLKDKSKNRFNERQSARIAVREEARRSGDTDGQDTETSKESTPGNGTDQLDEQ